MKLFRLYLMSLFIFLPSCGLLVAPKLAQALANKAVITESPGPYTYKVEIRESADWYTKITTLECDTTKRSISKVMRLKRFKPNEKMTPEKIIKTMTMWINGPGWKPGESLSKNKLDMLLILLNIEQAIQAVRIDGFCSKTGNKEFFKELLLGLSCDYVDGITVRDFK